MKQHIRICFLLSMLFLCLTGCGNREPALPANDGGEPWVVPTLTYGVMAYDRLEILDWDERRLEETSFCNFAESETGYYMVHDNILFYADKSNLDLWVPVCSSPDCGHLDYSCGARVQYFEILYRSGRLYYQVSNDLAQGYYNGESRIILASMAENGKNRKYVYSLPEECFKNMVGHGTLLTPECLYLTVTVLNPDGSRTVNFYLVRENGWECFYTRDATDTTENAWTEDLYVGNSSSLRLQGDTLFQCSAMEQGASVYFRLAGSEAQRIDTSGLPVENAFLSGNILRYFRTNSGYYDMDITTGQEVKLAEPRMENSDATVLLPNCIVETTLTGPSRFDLRTEGMCHSMEIFDGAAWRTVALPEELEYAGGKVLILFKGISSDSIFFVSRDMNDYLKTFQTSFYRIDLTQEELKAEFMFRYEPNWLKDNK